VCCSLLGFFPMHSDSQQFVSVACWVEPYETVTRNVIAVTFFRPPWVDAVDRGENPECPFESFSLRPAREHARTALTLPVLSHRATIGLSVWDMEPWPTAHL
jgi:hypothetical protein